MVERPPKETKYPAKGASRTASKKAASVAGSVLSQKPKATATPKGKAKTHGKNKK